MTKSDWLSIMQNRRQTHDNEVGPNQLFYLHILSFFFICLWLCLLYTVFVLWICCHKVYKKYAKKEAIDMTYKHIHKMCRIFGWIQILLMWFPKASRRKLYIDPDLKCPICLQSCVVPGKTTRYKNMCCFCETQKNYTGFKVDQIRHQVIRQPCMRGVD